jgi:hypothetical protein
MHGVPCQRSRKQRRGGIARRDRPIIGDETANIKRPARILKTSPDELAELRRRVAALEKTLEEIGEAAAEIAAGDDESPAAVLLIAKQS